MAKGTGLEAAAAYKIRKVIIYFCNKRCEHVRMERERNRNQPLNSKHYSTLRFFFLVSLHYLWTGKERAAFSRDQAET